MKIILNPDKDIVAIARQQLKETGGHCPCALVHTEDTKCMCKEFRDQIGNNMAGECHCGLYVAVGEENEV